jgi:hypothetical protein
MLQMFSSHVLGKIFQPFANDLFKPTNNSNVKKNSPMLQMNFVKVKYIESFPIQEILILKINLQNFASLY